MAAAMNIHVPTVEQEILRIQTALAQIQGLPQAWRLSKELMSRPNENVQFFAVLTIIVKLNTESTSISDEEALELLSCLIEWYRHSLTGGSRLVARKLVSALSTFFLRYHTLWPRFLDHLGLCLATGRTSRPDNPDTRIDVNSILSIISPQQTQALLWVIEHVIEDVVRLDPTSIINSDLYNAVLDNIESCTSAVARCLQVGDYPLAIIDDAVRCLKSWVSFVHKAPSRGHDMASPLRPLIGKVIECLTVEAVYESSVELLTEIMSNNPSLLTSDHLTLFNVLFKSSWATDFHRRISNGDFSFESVQFVQLLLAFADHRMSMLIQTCHSESLEFLSCVCDLLAAQGCPVVEDRIFVPVVEFWSSFAERIPDHLPLEQEAQAEWNAPALSILQKVCSSAWQKIVYPPSDVITTWDSNDRAGFIDSRKDVVDLTQSVYALIGPQLLGTFVEIVLLSLERSMWLQLEAAIYCLGGLADCCREDSRCDYFLASVFHSNLFSILRDEHAAVPARTQQTCLQMIEQYTEYFERNPILLPSVLELLFSTLGCRTMAPAASKSILRLCSSCRGHLHSQIDAFLGEYGRVVARYQLDCVTTEKTIGALASVAQAVQDPATRDVKYGCILQFIESDLEKCRRLKRMGGGGNAASRFCLICPDTSSEENECLHAALRVLRCLVSMGKGVQTPLETAIDIEHGNGPTSAASAILPELQQQIVASIIELQRMFPASREITEQICSILRVGFSETEPGPFVLPSSEVAQYLTSHTYSTPRVGLFISAACSFINSVRNRSHRSEVFSAIFVWVIELLKQLTNNSAGMAKSAAAYQRDIISAEPEVTQTAIELASRILTKEPKIILEMRPPQMTEFFFSFTLQALDGNEPLPKAAAAEFWATFVNLRDDEEGFQYTLSVAMTTLGPMLCQSLMRNIGGRASRSELDKLSEPLKKMIHRHPRAKEWLEAGLNHPSFPSSKFSQSDKKIFASKVTSLRGARATNQVVRDFWLAARGAKFTYAA